MAYIYTDEDFNKQWEDMEERMMWEQQVAEEMCVACDKMFHDGSSFCVVCQEEINETYIDVAGMTPQQIEFFVEDTKLAIQITNEEELPF